MHTAALGLGGTFFVPGAALRAPAEGIEMGPWVDAIVGVLVIAVLAVAGWSYVRGVLREAEHDAGDDPLRGMRLRHANPRRNTPARDSGPWDRGSMAETQDDPSDDSPRRDD